VRIRSSSQDGDRTGTETSVSPPNIVPRSTAKPDCFAVNQHRSGTPPNLNQTFDLSALFLETGVPIGAGWDPTKLSFYARISIALTESVEGSRSDTDSPHGIARAKPCSLRHIDHHGRKPLKECLPASSWSRFESASGHAVASCSSATKNCSFSRDVVRQSSRAVLRQRSNGVGLVVWRCQRSCLTG
jgi:hypothetical protein